MNELTERNTLYVVGKQEGGFLTALEFSDRRKMCFRVTTGSLELESVQCSAYIMNSY